MAAIFADDTFKCMFLMKILISIKKISLKYIPKGPIKNIPVLVQLGVDQAKSHYPNQRWYIVYWRIYALLGLNELTSPNTRPYDE